MTSDERQMCPALMGRGPGAEPAAQWALDRIVPSPSLRVNDWVPAGLGNNIIIKLFQQNKKTVAKRSPFI